MSTQREVQRPRPSALALAWVMKNRAWLEVTHPGKWIAVTPEGLVSVGNSATEVSEEAAAKGIKEPLLTAVRRKEFQGIDLIRKCH